MKLNFLYICMFIASSLSFASDATLTETIAKAAEEKESTYREEVKVNLEKKGDIVGIRELPMKKLFFVEAENGSYVVSADGRFIFDGRLVDVWHRKTINTLSDATAIQRTPVENIGFKPEEQLATFKVGNEKLPRSGVAFVDPTSQYTTQFLKHIEKNSEKYNFTIVLAPLVGGNNAVDRARRLWCATDKAAAKQDLINGTSLSFNDIEKVCSEEPIQMAGVLSGVFNIQELPHIIREDGLVSEGLPLDFDKWYEQP